MHLQRFLGAILRSTCGFAALLTVTVLVTSPTFAQCFQIDPVPVGVTEYPDETFGNEHGGIHSSTLMQGYAADEKVAAVVHLPSTGPLTEMRTTVIVNNTSASQALDVDLEYYDPAGVLVGTNTASIAPEGHYMELATPLTGSDWGTVRVVSTTAGHPGLVGATIYHTYRIGIPNGAASIGQITGTVGEKGEPGGEPGGNYVYFQEPQLSRTGAASMQQLQANQSDKNELFWGPLPISNISPIDFLNGNCPLAMVTNPNPTDTTIFVLGVDSQLNVVVSNTIVLPGFASWIDLPSFEFFLNTHAPTGQITYDLDLTYYVLGTDSIVGQGLMFDAFGGDMVPANRLRIGSTMMANTRSDRLHSPELILQAGPLATNSMFGIVNTAFVDIGPVEIQYRDRDGNLLGVETIASFPPFATRRITPSIAGGAPPGVSANLFAGNVTIRSCEPGLVGWNMKVTDTAVPGATPPGFTLPKAWGEILVGGNGEEPGLGVPLNGFNRLIGPINPVRVDGVSTLSEPGYNHLHTFGTSNVLFNWYRFFDAVGAELTEFSPLFFSNGLEFGATSFSYLDDFAPLPATAPRPLVALTPQIFVNTKYEYEVPGASGVNAIGGYIYLLPWEGFVIPDPEGPFQSPGGGGSYQGPGDIIP